MQPRLQHKRAWGRRDEAAALYPSVVEAIAAGTVVRFLDLRFLETVAGIAAAAGRNWEAGESHFRWALHLAADLANRMEQAEARRFHGQMLADRPARGTSPGPAPCSPKR